VRKDDREELIVRERWVWEWIAYQESKHYPLSVQISSSLTQSTGTLPMSFVLSARSKQLGQTASRLPEMSFPPRVLWVVLEAGADTVKVGIRTGSVCTARIITGVEVPQITAIAEGVKIETKMDRCVITDGASNIPEIL
jgi:hypothetical protein